MGGIEDLLRSTGREMRHQTESIKNYTYNLNGTWKGEARKGFDEAHSTSLKIAQRIEKKIENMEAVARSLEESVRTAERDRLNKVKRK